VAHKGHQTPGFCLANAQVIFNSSAFIFNAPGLITKYSGFYYIPGFHFQNLRFSFLKPQVFIFKTPGFYFQNPRFLFLKPQVFIFKTSGFHF
jgi:hypothetical protein